MTKIPAFPAFRIHDDKGRAGVEPTTIDQLGEDAVLIRVDWSSINYKDALAGTGRGKILRRFPLIGGIDLAGTVVESADKRFSAGQPVIVTGYGLSQTHDGGYSRYARVPGDWVVAMPEGMTARTAMILGTAGFTAGLALERMEMIGRTPAHGPIAITGATGGVGSIAIDLFTQAGYEAVAITRKTTRADELRGFGATRVAHPSEFDMGTRPLEAALWGGAVDSVGGELLAWLTRTTNPWGAIASIGLAGGHQLSTTVMPFILRGVSLIGINSADCAMDLRLKVWARLAGANAPRHLEELVSQEIGLDELMPTFQRLLDGDHAGRTLVRLRD